MKIEIKEDPTPDDKGNWVVIIDDVQRSRHWYRSQALMEAEIVLSREGTAQWNLEYTKIKGGDT